MIDQKIAQVISLIDSHGWDPNREDWPSYDFRAALDLLRAFLVGYMSSGGSESSVDLIMDQLDEIRQLAQGASLLATYETIRSRLKGFG